MIANHVTNEGESTWFEGVQLLRCTRVLGPRVLRSPEVVHAARIVNSPA